MSTSISLIEALLIAVLQGVTELFPISSLGHAVVLPRLFSSMIDQKSPAFLPFLVLLHTGTAAALLTYFWRDWLGLATGILGQGTPTRVAEARRMAVLIVIATIPAVILGFTLNAFFRTLFGTPVIAAMFLFLNGIMLLLGERLRGHSGSGPVKPLTALTPKDALAIGVLQCGALFPGISRAGATMIGGLLRGLDHQAAAHFSFLIATPIIIGATALEARHLLHESVPPGVLQTAVIASVVAGATAYATTAFLMRYFRNHDDWALKPFGYYCLAFGALTTAWLLFA